MGLERGHLEYIHNPFGGCCPFCLNEKPNWTERRVLLKKIRYRCSVCGAEVVVKLADVLSGNYNSAKILIDSLGNYNQSYKIYLFRWITFQEFYGNSIMSQHYQKAVPVDKGFPPSCRLCKNGQNEANGEATNCMKFEFRGNPDFICDSYVDGFSETASRFLNVINKTNRV